MRSVDLIAQAQLDRRAAVLRKSIQQTQVRPGWIHYMRHVLGIKLAKLAKRAGVSLSTTAQAERREAQGRVTLDTLKKMANAMECDFAYAFVPRKKVKDILKDRATEKAREIVLKADTHMALEDQKVSVALRERIERVASELIQKGDVW
ncbi:MAG: helix-turn-helix domain-containing protein [Deltaproteobacteria bacterium]|nr:helix-turn-helix domain-containing protein [Deltaproteobacteria bacterium]